MGFRYRKTISLVPGIRININRHGFSTTIGPRGANINVGPRGTFANASFPGTGISYRSRIDKPQYQRTRSRSVTANSGPLPTDAFIIPGTKVEYGSADVSELTSQGLDTFKKLVLETRDRKSEIEAEIRRAKKQLLWLKVKSALSIMLLFGFLPSISKKQKNAANEAREDIDNLKINLSNTKIIVDIDTETEIGTPFRNLEAAFTALAGSQAKWGVLATNLIDRVKARSWAGRIVDRRKVSLWRGSDPLIETKMQPLAFGTLKQRSNLYFYPGFVVVSGVSDFALIDMIELTCNAQQTRFCETESCPGDAEMIGRTWAKANKDGSRDRRFSNNRPLPIVRYGSLHFASPSGLNEAYLFSKAQPCVDFGNALFSIKQALVKVSKPYGAGIQYLGR